MTVATTTRKQTFAGGQGSLAFAFKALPDHPEDIKVKATLIATGVDTDLTYSSEYSVALAADGVGGVVTVSPSFSTAYTQTVYRETTDKQESDYDDFNQFPADTLEEDLDRRTMISQENAEAIARTIRLPITSSADAEMPSPEADTFLGWNSAADALENKTLPDPSILIKATQSNAEAATNDTDYMTPLQVKNEVQKSGAVLIPIGNIPYNDEDNMASNSAVHVPTQQSVKAYVDGKSSTLSSKLIQATHNVATTGTQVISGVGFAPKAFTCISAIDAGTYGFSFCLCDSTPTAKSICVTGGTTPIANTQVVYLSNGGNVAYAGLASLDADGCTITWGKDGTPTGTATMNFLFLR